MTLQQLKYVTAVAETGTISGAAQALFLSQPSLTAAIHDLEQELNITIFSRTNRGVALTPAGDEFLGYARQVLEQTDLIEERYTGSAPRRHRFSVSTQHYSFAVEAFVDLLQEHGGPEYDFCIRETKTYEIIEDVARLRSEVGVLYLNAFNTPVLTRVIREHELEFHSLFTARPHVFVSRTNPLAGRPSVTLDDLALYPRLSYEQGEHNAFYFSEEILSTLECAKEIMVSDRATLFNLLIGLDGYTICSGVINSTLNGPNIVAVPLDVDDHMEIGYLLHKRTVPSRFALSYIEALRRHTVGDSQHIHQRGLLHLGQQLQLGHQVGVGGGVLVQLLQLQILQHRPKGPQYLVGVRVAQHGVEVKVVPVPVVIGPLGQLRRLLPPVRPGQALGLLQRAGDRFGEPLGVPGVAQAAPQQEDQQGQGGGQLLDLCPAPLHGSPSLSTT